MKEKKNTLKNRNNGKHTDKNPLSVPDKGDLPFPSTLEALDREVAFYRHRAGQVFFLSLVFEILILSGHKGTFEFPESTLWMEPLVYNLLFVVVAIVGIILGSEYRSRIRYIKDSRQELLAKSDYKNAYPTEDVQRFSEIHVLYFVLGFLSTLGMILVWIKYFLPEVPTK